MHWHLWGTLFLTCCRAHCLRIALGMLSPTDALQVQCWSVEVIVSPKVIQLRIQLQLSCHLRIETHQWMKKKIMCIVILLQVSELETHLEQPRVQQQI